MSAASVITLLGGLAFFLFGMSLMSDALKKVAGSRLETILARLTSNRLKAVLLGSVVTAVIQSSSATSVMAVGFVNSGIMKLGQAIGIIMGANIGTTATGWLLTLAGVEEGSAAASLLSSAVIFALVAVIGILLYMAGKSVSAKSIGVILLALSVLMSGMQTMSAAMKPLQESEAFLNAITLVSNPVLALLIGALITAVIQSASASIGILQALTITGAIPFSLAMPMVMGMNIGACVPVLISAIGANRSGQRTAFIYLYYNVLGTAAFAVLYGIVGLFVHFPFLDQAATSFSIAVFNTVFNIFATVVLFPFVPQLEKLVCATFPDKGESEEDEVCQVSLLDERFLQYPPLAVEQSGKTLNLMAAAAAKNLTKAIDLFTRFDQVKFDKIMSRENVVDSYEDKLGNYLVRLNSQELSQEETHQTAKFLHSLTNLERISDHAVNLAQLAEEMHRKGLSFSADARGELASCVAAIREIVDLSIQALTQDDQSAARRVEPLEEAVDTLTEEMKVRHIRRVQGGQCTLELGFIFNDCINNFERVADHCSNLAVAVLEAKDDTMEAHDYTQSLRRQKGQKEFHDMVDFYQSKYTLPPETQGAEGQPPVPTPSPQ